MARGGSAAVAYSYDGNALDDIVEMSGGEIEVETVDTTAFGDSVKTSGVTGVRSVSDITLKGFFDPAANSAWVRLGAPVTTVGAAAKNFVVTYQSGITRTFQCIVVRRDPMPAQGEQTMFEAVLKVAGTTITEDYTV